MGRDKNSNLKMDHKESRVKNANLDTTVTGFDPKKPQKKNPL